MWRGEDVFDWFYWLDLFKSFWLIYGFCGCFLRSFLGVWVVFFWAFMVDGDILSCSHKSLRRYFLVDVTQHIQLEVGVLWVFIGVFLNWDLGDG